MSGSKSILGAYSKNNGNNIMYFGAYSQPKQSHTTSVEYILTSNAAFINSSVSLEDQIVEAIHEAGHLIGLSDRYTRVGPKKLSVPNLGFKLDIFGKCGGVGFNQIHYNSFADYFKNSMIMFANGQLLNSTFSANNVVDRKKDGSFAEIGNEDSHDSVISLPTKKNTLSEAELDERFRDRPTLVKVGDTYVKKQ